MVWLIKISDPFDCISATQKISSAFCTLQEKLKSQIVQIICFFIVLLLIYLMLSVTWSSPMCPFSKINMLTYSRNIVEDWGEQAWHLAWPFTILQNDDIMISWDFLRLTAPAAMPGHLGAVSLKKISWYCNIVKGQA